MASAYLQNTTTTPTDTKKFTWSFWFKRSKILIGASAQRFINIHQDANNKVNSEFGTDDRFYYFDKRGGSTVFNIETLQNFRDPSAWYHMVIAVDTTQSTQSDRVKVYVNGTLADLNTLTAPALNAETGTQVVTATNQRRIGTTDTASTFYDGLVTHMHFTDGYTYQASTFGETDSTSGIWKPKTSPSVTYGSNGFFLKFENSGSMGTDSSGNGNNFTVSGTITQTEDTPSNNFATGNPLHVDGTSASAFINGNLTHTNNVSAVSSLAINKGKWYMEFKRQDNGGSITNWMYCGFVKADRTGLRLYRSSNGDYYNGSSYSSYGASWGDGDIVGVALDYDNDTIEFYKNGTSQGSKTSIGICDGDFVLPIWQCSQSSGSPYFHANFGNGRFGTTALASSNSDGAGLGLFEYSVPSGYYALCTKNIKNYG